MLRQLRHVWATEQIDAPFAHVKPNVERNFSGHDFDPDRT